jgi:V/A-type H+-transporting ATPase subunit I
LEFSQQAGKTLIGAPDKIAKDALECLNGWIKQAEGLMEEQLALESSRQEYALLLEYLVALQGASADIARLSHHTEYLYKGLFACPKGQNLEAELCTALDGVVTGTEHTFFVTADLPENQAIIESACAAESCLNIEVPDWLSADPVEQLSQLKIRLAEIGHQRDVLAQRLDAGKKDPLIVSALETMALLSWFVDNVESLPGDQKLCHVTGWTTAEQTDKLQQVLTAAGAHANIRFAQAPDDIHPPVSLLLPAWARPFQPFIEMLGTPDRSEVNPALLLPAVVSLLFGYMFPDVGHGLVLVLLSLLLYRRWPKGRFLIPCGLSATLFGFVFGEVFGLEGILEPLWLKPLEQPLMILVPPMFFGVGLMMLGLIFNGIEAYWRAVLRSWFLRDAAVLVMYAALLGGIFIPHLLWFSVVALFWFVLGQLTIAAPNRLTELLRNLALLLQSIFELLLNTVSFIRVGAFALAHAALSAAVMQIVDGISNPALYMIFLVLGHLTIIGIEGLVVFVQTTRLVLFEFFTRFLSAEGRIFKPLSSPVMPHSQDIGH